jgi:HlyD family secretion protein
MAAASAAQQDVQVAAANADLAKTALKRVQQLYSISHATADEEDRARAELRRADATLRSARFAVEVANHEVEAARTALRYSAAEENGGAAAERVLIRSPIDGDLLKIYRKSEGVIEAGQALVEVGDPRALEVEVDVLSADAVRLASGVRVLFERWGGPRPLEGVVRVVEPVGFTKISALGVEEQRVLVIADLTSAPSEWQQLGDGYHVEASFILWESAKVLQVPASALFHHRDGWAAFVIADGRAERREVEVGHRNGLEAELLAGIAAGETVIVHPDDKIDDGTRVALR